MIKLLIITCIGAICSHSTNENTFVTMDSCTKVAPILAGMQSSDMKEKNSVLVRMSGLQPEFLFICSGENEEFIVTSSEHMEEWFIEPLISKEK